MQRPMQGPMFEWEEDNFSFEDSDRFEEVSKYHKNSAHSI